MAYAISEGHKKFAALIPRSAYGDVTEQAFREAVTAGGGTIGTVERFSPGAGAVMDQTAAIAKAEPDAVFIARAVPCCAALPPRWPIAASTPAR